MNNNNNKGYMMILDTDYSLVNKSFENVCHLISETFCGHKSVKIGDETFDLYFDDEFLSKDYKINKLATLIAKEVIMGDAFLAKRGFDENYEQLSLMLTKQEADELMKIIIEEKNKNK